MTSVLLKRDVETGADQAEISTETKELCQADLYMVMFNVFGIGSESVTKGNWSRTKGSLAVGVTDRKAFQDAANAIYKKYGEIEAAYGFKDATNLW
jgi:hypothetical protein